MNPVKVTFFDNARNIFSWRFHEALLATGALTATVRSAPILPSEVD